MTGMIVSSYNTTSFIKRTTWLASWPFVDRAGDKRKCRAYAKVVVDGSGQSVVENRQTAVGEVGSRDNEGLAFAQFSRTWASRKPNTEDMQEQVTLLERR